MRYSIQNGLGEVYGIFAFPATDKKVDTLETELAQDLNDILGVNRVVTISDGDEDRVVIDISPFLGIVQDESIVRIHQTVGRLAVPRPPDLPQIER